MSSSLKDKVPPHNLEAERAALGAVLMSPESFDLLLRYLRAEDFFQSAHRLIFQAISKLDGSGSALDIITLTDYLKKEGLLEKSGGAAYISSLSSEVPTSANIEYYAKIVQGCSIRRKLAKIGGQVVSSSFDETEDPRLLIENAEREIFSITDSFATSEIKTPRQVLHKIIEHIERRFHESDAYDGVPSGFPDLDSMTGGFQDSDFIILGARPSIGKTALATSMASFMALKKKIPVGFFTLEMPVEALTMRILAAEARINSENMRKGFMQPSDFTKINEAASTFYEAPLFIDDTPNIRLLDLRAQARRMLRQHKIQALFIDYISLIQPENRLLPRHEQIAETSRSLKSLARELNIPLIVLSQLRRETEGKAPSLADLRESGSLEQDADVVMLLHRDRNIEKNKIPTTIKTELILCKQRNGPTGRLEILFEPAFTRYRPQEVQPV